MWPHPTTKIPQCGVFVKCLLCISTVRVCRMHIIRSPASAVSDQLAGTISRVIWERILCNHRTWKKNRTESTGILCMVQPFFGLHSTTPRWHCPLKRCNTMNEFLFFVDRVVKLHNIRQGSGRFNIPSGFTGSALCLKLGEGMGWDCWRRRLELQLVLPAAGTGAPRGGD